MRIYSAGTTLCVIWRTCLFGRNRDDAYAAFLSYGGGSELMRDGDKDGIWDTMGAGSP